MSDEKVLTKEIAEQFLADEDSVDLSEFTAIEDEAAEVAALVHALKRCPKLSVQQCASWKRL